MIWPTYWTYSLMEWRLTSFPLELIIVLDSHSVWYPVCRTTENRSWSLSLQWYSFLTLNSEHLVGFCRYSYCAYSDTEVGVNSFELHIDCQLSKRGVMYLFYSRKRHIPSKSKSNMWVISSLLFRFFVCWHKYFIIWLYIHNVYCIYIQ